MVVHTIERSVLQPDAPTIERKLRHCKTIKTRDDLWQLHAIVSDAIDAGELLDIDLWEVHYEPQEEA